MTEPKLYWVNASLRGGLAVVTRPRHAGHFGALKAAGIDVLVSLLEPEEALAVGLGEEARHCARAGIEFLSFPIEDHGVPTAFEAVEELVARLIGHLDAGRGVAAHCYAGLGRSPLLVASVLIRHGFTDEEAIRLVSEARGYGVPEMEEQHRWLYGLADRAGRFDADSEPC